MTEKIDPAEWFRERTQDGIADGRRQRSSNSRTQIIQAVLDIIKETRTVPNAAQVAERAKIGLRSVFRNFSDMESLFNDVSSVLEQEILPLIAKPILGDTLEEQLTDLIATRVIVYEAMYPYQSALISIRKTSAFGRERHNLQVQLIRMQIQGLIQHIPGYEIYKIEALDLLLCYLSWQRLTEEQSLKREQIKVIFLTTALKILDLTPAKP